MYLVNPSPYHLQVLADPLKGLPQVLLWCLVLESTPLLPFAGPEQNDHSITKS